MDYKLVIRQLEKPEVKERFETIIIDTVSIAWDLCEQYICAQNSVQKINDIPWGQGFTAAKKEFENSLRKITQLGYGVVLIAHNSTRIEKTADGSEIEIISPELPKRAAEICNGIVDIIGYIGTEFADGKAQRFLYTRETPTLFAGSRFKYLAPKIPFGYNELVNAISEAIEKSEQNDGVTIVEHGQLTPIQTEELNYNDLMAEAKYLWDELVVKNQNEENAKIILKKLEIAFGRPIRLSEITEDQKDILNLALIDMREMANK